MIPARRVQVERERTARAVAWRNGGLGASAIAMMSFLILSQGYGAKSGTVPSTPAPAPPNAPSVPGVSATPTDTSVLVTSTAFSGDVGDTHDSTRWRIAKFSDDSDVLVWTTADSLTSFQGAGLGYDVPLITDTSYWLQASHHGAVSGEWSGYGAATNFTATASSATLIFHSDWSSSTGSSDNAVTDFTKDQPWSGNKGSTCGTVVTDTVDWQSALPGDAHALTIAHCDGVNSQGVRIGTNQPNTGFLPAMGLGESRAMRFYIKVIAPNQSAVNWDGSSHPFQDAAGGSNTSWEFDIYQDGSQNGTWSPHWEPRHNGGQQKYTIGGVHDESNTAARIPKDSVYRFEVKMTTHPSIANSVDWEFKLYSADGSIRVDSDQWINRLTDTPSSEVDWLVMGSNWANWHRNIQLGNNGWSASGSGFLPYVTWHWGAFAICTDWCGAYPLPGEDGP